MPTKKIIKVLIVDDNPDHIDLLKRHLTKSRTTARYATSDADTASEGIAAAKLNQFDVLLLDLSLPDSSPEKTLRTFTKEFPTLPIVVLSSLVDEELVQNAIESGAQDYLDKSLLHGDAVDRTIRYAIERKASLLQLNAQNDELERFAHTVAHEIKNPLQTILTTLCLVNESSGHLLQEKLAALVENGISECQHLAGLVDDLLKYAEQPNSSFVLESVNLHQIIQRVIANTEKLPEFDLAKIEIKGQLPKVMGSEIYLEQIFQNLISNSFRYRSEDPVEIQITSTQNEDYQEITVRDNGIGIPLEKQDRIFEPFYRAHRDHGIRGTGIGLNFCRSAVEKMKGSITVKSVEGEGSQFIVSLLKSD